MPTPKSIVLAVSSLLAAACADTPGAPGPKESTGRAASAVNPEDSINSVSYTFWISGVDVLQSDDIPGGAYVDYAALGAQVTNYVTKAKRVNPVQGCSLGSAPKGATLKTCAAQSTTGAAPGSTITQTIDLANETDIVDVAVSLSNIENTPSVNADSAAKASQLGLGGQALGVGGALLGIASGPVGGILGALGAAVSLLSMTTQNSQTSCAGGLVSTAPTPYALQVDTLWGWESIPNPTLDTFYLTYSGRQLEALTASGPVTLSFPVSVQWPQTHPAGSNDPVALWGDPPGACSSAHDIHVTISRVPNSGPAATPISGGAVARAVPGGVAYDGPVPDPGHQALANIEWTSQSGWTASLVSQSILAAVGSAQTATLSRQVPPPGQQLQIIQPPDHDTPGTTNVTGALDSFWFDGAGSLMLSTLPPGGAWSTATYLSKVGGSGNRLTATSRTPSSMDVFWVDSTGTLMTTTWPQSALPVLHSVATGVAPASANLASVALTYTSMHVLYVGADGGLHDASTANAGGQWTITNVGGGSLATPGAHLTAVARDANTVDAFFIGTNHQVYQAHFASTPVNGGTIGWSAPAPVPGASGTPGGPLSAVSRTQASIDLLYAGQNHLQFVQFNSGTSATWNAPVALSSPGLITADGDISFVARDSQNTAVQYRDGFGGWYTGTWNQTSGAWQFAHPVLPTWKWQGWDSAAGGLVTDASLTSTDASEIVTAATGPDGTVWYQIHDSDVSSSWLGWHSLGNAGHALTDAPAIVHAGSKLEVFVRDPVTTHLLHQEGLCESSTSCDSPTWNAHGWEDIQGTLIPGTPTVVVSQPGNQINVFATWTDNSAHVIMGTGYGEMGPFYKLQLVNGVWKPVFGYGAWTNLSGGVLNEPGAVSWGDDRLDVFVRGTDNGLYHRYSNDNGATWYPTNGAWEALHGTAYTTPVAVSWGSGRLDVFTGSSGNDGVSHYAWNGSYWAWDVIVGLPAGRSSSGHPTAIAHGVGLIDVFVQGQDSGLYTATMAQVAPAAWSPFTEIESCYKTGGAPALVSRDGSNIDLVINSADGDASIWHTSTSGIFTGQGLAEPRTCY